MRKLSLLFLITLAFLLGCRKQTGDVDPVDAENILLNKAKTFVKETLNYNENAKYSLNKFEFVWSNSVTKKSKNGTEYVQILLRNRNPIDRSTYDADTKKSYDLPDLQFAYFRDQQGNERGVVIELIPDNKYAEKHVDYSNVSDYSGMELLWNLDGTFYDGYRYENGKEIRKLFAGSGSGRTSDYYCVYTYQEYITCNCMSLMGFDFFLYGKYITYSSLTGPQYPPSPYFQGYTCTPWIPNSAQKIGEDCVTVPDNPGPGPGTVPVVPPIPGSPCANAAALAASASWRSMWQDLKGKVFTNYEAGWMIRNPGSEYVEGAPNTAALVFYVTSPMDGMVHSHYAGTAMYDVFTAADLLFLAQMYQDGGMTDPAKFYIGLVTPGDKAYMIQVENVQKFSAWVDYVAGTTDKKTDFIRGYTTWPFHIREEFNGAQNRQSLANYLKVSESGLRMLEGNADFTKWKTLTTSDNNGGVIVDPCN